jgi:hypothetical protein
MLDSNRLPSPEVTIGTFGDWAGVTAELNRLPATLKSSALYGQRKAAEKLLKIVKGHIDNQDLNWAPLIRPDLSNDPRILVDNETYRNNIKTWQVGGQRFVGVKRDVINTRGQFVWMVAALHEFKSYNGGPFRGLWTPSVEEMGGAAGVRDIIGKVIFNKISKV